ncbi:MAG: hypothetical protein IVW54_16895 [Candidatus Binataceae bacterium]|nr:hypothetical protein [Candidatus Binataceae bacterium]
MSRVKLYSPPKGSYDMPYSWIYNLGSTPPDNSDLLNQFVYIQGGYGDFIMRRVVGMSRVLEQAVYGPPIRGGQYRLYDRQKNAMSSVPLYSYSAGPGTSVGEQDFGICPEELYKETGRIAFDLFDILRISTSPNASQIAFQGVRRIQGPYQRQPNYRARSKSFTYEIVQVIPDVFPAGPFTARLKVDDYDFELHNIIILQDSNVFVSGGGEGLATLTFAALPGVSFTLQITNPAPLANQPFVFTVVPGVSITVQIATGPTGDPISSGQDFLNAFLASPAAQAMTTLQVTDPGNGLVDQALVVIGPGVFGAGLSDTVASLLIYDSNKRPISSAPMLDIYCDGAPASPVVNGFNFNNFPVYGDGALVPPLYYPKDTQIQIDFFSQIETQAVPPITLHVYLVGKQYYPC